MPRFDRTGPMGMGPMTGAARGWCTASGRSFGPMSGGPWSGFGRTRGWARWWGRGRGFRRMHPWFDMVQGGFYRPGIDPFAVPYSPEQELNALKNEAEALRNELDTIHRRIKDIESDQAQTD